MIKESLLKFYVGNKPIGSHPPLLVVVGDNSRARIYFGEHYLFVDFKKLPFVARRDVVSPADADGETFDYEAFPELFSAESLLKSQFTAAIAHFQSAFSGLDMKAYKEIFWEGRNFEFTESDKSPLIRFHLSGLHAKEIDAMFAYTRSKKLQEIKAELHRLPKIKIDVGYPNDGK